jgi:hypothetical protein
MPARRRHEGSSHRLLDPVPFPRLSQRHSTALPSLKRYEKRYEEIDSYEFRWIRTSKTAGAPAKDTPARSVYLLLDYRHVRTVAALGLLDANTEFVPRSMVAGRELGEALEDLSE